MRSAALLSLVLAGCGAGGADTGSNPDGNSSGDASGCGVAITFDPVTPIAGPGSQVRAAAHVSGGTGVVTYSWAVSLSGTTVPFTSQAIDNSQIGFDIPDPGPYYVYVNVTGGTSCPTGSGTVNVQAPGAHVATYRLRVVSLGAPPDETIIQVHGGADFAHSVSVDPGLPFSGAVTNGATAVPAYLRFVPAGQPGAYVEAFSSSVGAYAVQLSGQAHQVLIVPMLAGLAPRIASWLVTTTGLSVDPGTPVAGTVLGPAGAPIAGAEVVLTSGGVPSTLAITASDGSFTVHESFAAGASVTAKVTPPAASGLPRLDATAAFDLTQALQIHYAASLVTCNLLGTPVQRGGTNQPGARVTVAGTLAGVAGTITAGIAANATGTVRIATTASGTGALPSILVPAAPLSAVVDLGAGDLAVAAIDTSACAAQTITAPVRIAAPGVATDAQTIARAGIAVEAVPVGALALAGASAITTSSGAAGAFSLLLASGGHYDVRFTDPGGRGAPLVVPGVDASGVPALATLAPAIRVSGVIMLQGTNQPLGGASVQILCAVCTGVAASQPIAETATDASGHYAMAIPDPGTM